MKKILISILILLALTGCSKKQNNTNYIAYVNPVLTNQNNFVNKTSRGYKYYLPKGVSLIKDVDFNQKFKCYDTYIYLNADILSYYHKIEPLISNNEPNMYYRTFEKNNKIGYIKIKNENDKFYVEILYNYAKIELYTKESNLKNIITYATIIITSIQYNDEIIESIVNENYFSSMETEYKIIKPTENGETFEQYQEEYSSYQEDILPDEKTINNQNN